MDCVVFSVSIRRLSVVVMSVPLIGIIVCFVSAYIVHEDINKTRCPVYNFIPSVSAVTGVSPQCYFWRLCVALHLVPRGLFTWLGRQHAVARVVHVSPACRRCYNHLVAALFSLGVCELLSLAGVTFVSNKENYPLHEKMFALFIGSCSWYMVITLVTDWLSWPSLSSVHHYRAYRIKCAVFVVYTSLVLGLLYNFWKHRFHCQELAFSWFSLCEYCICVCIMVFHMLVLRDVPDLSLAVGRPCSAAPSPSGQLTYAKLTDTLSAANGVVRSRHLT